MQELVPCVRPSGFDALGGGTWNVGKHCEEHIGLHFEKCKPVDNLCYGSQSDE